LARGGGGEGRAISSPDKCRSNKTGTLSIRRLRRLPVPLDRSFKAAITAVAVLLLAVAGCGDEGVAEGAVVTVYVSAPLCAEAEQGLARSGQPDSVRVQVVCLADAEGRGQLDLAKIGGNARRATQDSTTVAYIGEPTPAASRFSETVLDTADIAQLSELSGSAAMSRVLRAIRSAGDSGSLRESVQDALGES
jgi:hypothetical protein